MPLKAIVSAINILTCGADLIFVDLIITTILREQHKYEVTLAILLITLS